MIPLSRATALSAAAIAKAGGRRPLLKPEYHVYILRCIDNTYYIGKTKDLEKRLNRHQKGMVSYTVRRVPIKLVCYTTFFDEWTAAKFEKYLKSRSGRAFAKRHFFPEEMQDNQTDQIQDGLTP